MFMRAGAVAVLGLSLAGCGLSAGSGAPNVEPVAVAVADRAVTRAICGPGSRPELDLQGRVPVQDKEAGGSRRAFEGYSCNLEPVGEKEGNGALWQMAWYEDCAYYGLGVGFANGNTAGFVPGAPNVPGGGTAVVDVSDPAKPVRTVTLTTPAMMDPWETLKVNERRGLLAGSSVSIEGPAFDLYDIKKSAATDCKTPVLAASSVMGRMGHEGEWALDGQTYWSSGFIVPLTTAVDVSNPHAPVTVASINDGVHGLSLNEDGTRIYAAEFSREQTPEGEPSNGLEIWDVTQIQNRGSTVSSTVVPTPIIGSVYWDDGATAQMTIPVTIQGKPYVIFIDEGGQGMARIIDISDERNPVVVSKLKLEINMPDAAPLRIVDGMAPGANNTGSGGFNYQGHYCSVPQREEPGIVACSYFWSGVRVFDIRDPRNPREIAYFIPPLDPTDDGNAHASSAIRLIPERAEMWFTNQTTGFHVVRFTNGVWPFTN